MHPIGCHPSEVVVLRAAQDQLLLPVLTHNSKLSNSRLKNHAVRFVLNGQRSGHTNSSPSLKSLPPGCYSTCQESSRYWFCRIGTETVPAKWSSDAQLSPQPVFSVRLHPAPVLPKLQASKQELVERSPPPRKLSARLGIPAHPAAMVRHASVSVCAAISL
jgi:hypothetical protein